MAKCCVEGCVVASTKDITYFRFPTKKQLRKQWEVALGSRVKPKVNSMVCSRHFLDTECETARGRKKLKAGAVPSVFEKKAKESSPSKEPLEIKSNDTEPPLLPNKNASIDDSNINNNCKDKEEYLEKIALVKKGEIPVSKGKDKLIDNGKDIAEEKKDEEENRVVDRIEVGSDKGKEVDANVVENGKDKSKDSAPQLPEDSGDIDKQTIEDIEDILTNYHIKQDKAHNIHVAEEVETPIIDLDKEKDAVFIEISVDKGGADKGDCMMVMESVQVELDPGDLMLADPEDSHVDQVIDTVHIDDGDDDIRTEDPISLLTSSDEDDVIIQEPHIDTVEVSDETDEDDMPLVKLLKKRHTEKTEEPELAKILWGMYEYYCVQCHFTTSSGTEYRKHTASHQKVLMMCQICGYMTASESQFTKHEKQHGEKKYKCHLCSYKAKHNMSLVYHMKEHKAELVSAGESRPRRRRKRYAARLAKHTHDDYVP